MPLDIDRYAGVASTIQRWDPRFRIFALGVFAFSVALLKTLPMAGLALLAAMGFLAITGMPLAFISGGLTWVILFLLPFFGILPFTYPGTPAMYLLGLPFSWEGLRLALLIITKAVAIVLTSYAVFGSSRFDISMLALQRLKCPSILVQMLLFSYRYIFVFVEEMGRMSTAMRVRGFVMGTNLYTLQVVGNFVGSLLVRSFERTERVYKAMLSKGYQGQLQSLVTFQSQPKDFFKAGLVLAVALLLLIGDFGGPFPEARQGWF